MRTEAVSAETDIVQGIRLAISRGPCRVFRNNRGALEDKNGRWVQFGVGGDGAGDLIGWQTCVITADMVGQRIAQFVSIEVKRPKGRTDKKRTEDQARWRDAVNAAGGIGVECRSVDEAVTALATQSRERL